MTSLGLKYHEVDMTAAQSDKCSNFHSIKPPTNWRIEENGTCKACKSFQPWKRRGRQAAPTLRFSKSLNSKHINVNQFNKKNKTWYNRWHQINKACISTDVILNKHQGKLATNMRPKSTVCFLIILNKIINLMWARRNIQLEN